MKQFFKFMFASMLGVFLTIILFIILSIAIIGALVSSAGSEKPLKVTKGSILHINLKSQLKDRTSDNPFENFDFINMKSTSQPGLNDLLKNLKKAAEDSNIEGIYIDLSGALGGMASIEELRNGLLEFRESKKFILAYSDFYTQSNYYLATAADEIWLNPEGIVDFRGISAQLPFLKGLFEKLEIEPQIIRHGKFKSAIEPFILDKMSDENREQVSKYINSFWNHFVSEISMARNIDKQELLKAANEFSLQTAEDALAFNMIDKIGYKDEFIDVLKEKSGKGEDEDFKLVTMKRYTRAPEPGALKEFTREKIAVIYAAGNIVSGKGNPDEIGSESLSEVIRKARKDDKVKAVVLRVNSGGGDALASEVIWREMDLCRKVKPVIVSMSDVAASGGYYIACSADAIVAQPNTVTGSIGVFGLLFNTQRMFKNKFGIMFDGYRTSQFADMGNPTRPLTEAERQIFQNSVERVYATFTGRVADGRGMTVANVDSLGQGRVWSGVDALNNGLVDTLGGLDLAIALAAEKADLTNYRVSEMPEKKDPFQQLLKEFSGEVESRWLRNKLGENYEAIQQLESLLKHKGIQARMMIEIIGF